MATSKKGNVQIIPLHNMRIGAAVAGEWYQQLTGTSLFDYTAGTRPVQSAPSFQGPGVSIGSLDITSMTFDFGVFLPHLPIYRKLEKAYRKGNQLVAIRMDVYSQEIPAVPPAATVSVAAPAASVEAKAKGGVITTSSVDLKKMFASNQIEVGDILQIGLLVGDTTQSTMAPKSRIVNRIDVNDDGEYENVYVSNLDGSDATAIGTAASVKALTPGWRLDFNGYITQFGSLSGDSAGSPSLSSGMVVTPQAVIPSSIPALFTEEGSGW